MITLLMMVMAVTIKLLESFTSAMVTPVPMSAVSLVASAMGRVILQADGSGGCGCFSYLAAKV